MKLREMLVDVTGAKITGDTEREIAGVVYDALRVKKDFLYVAIDMYTQLDKIELPDGHEFVDKAIAAGATAVILDHDMPVPDGITKIIVKSTRAALADVAGVFYGNPSRKMTMIGITGTNGKTTTTHVVEAILGQKYRVGLIGTLYYKVAGDVRKSKDTTPEPPDVQEIFTTMVNEKVTHCCMEVSSHGVEFHRVDDVNYLIGAWTNFTQDHLDFHKTMEAYRECKLEFMRRIDPNGCAIVNMDDPSAELFKAASRAKVLTFGIEKEADIMAKDIVYSVSGTQFTLVTPKGSVKVNSRLRGQFNVSNSLTGAACCYALGEDLETIRTGLERPIVVAGRFQPVERGQDFVCIVDYAHTPDGMVKVLAASRATKPARIVTVFGCGGDRDPTKRPIMGQIAAEQSDHVIITDDNPRTEDPEKITADILKGIPAGAKHVEVVHDRYQAIEKAVNMAQPGDLILIAGKGHETTQTLKDTTLEFNDFKVADEVVAKRLGAK